MNLLFQIPRPVIFAHRGASAYAPENTIASFNLAKKLGARAVELDVKLTLDGKVVVIHDPNTLRTTGQNRWVNQTNFSELSKLDAGSFFSDQFLDERIPLLEEVIDCLGSEILINIELTNYNSPNDSLVEKTVAIVVRKGVQENVLFSSFAPINLLKARGLLPEVPVGILAAEGREGWWTRSLIGRWFFPGMIHPHLGDVTRGFIQREHNRNRRVHVWTVNRKEDMKKLIELKVDGIFTDELALAKQTLEDG